MAEVNVAWEIETNYLLHYSHITQGNWNENRNSQNHLRNLSMSPAGPWEPRPCWLQFEFLCSILVQVMTRGALQWCCSPHSGISSEFRQLRPSPSCSSCLQSPEHDERIKPITSEPPGPLNTSHQAFVIPGLLSRVKTNLAELKW